MATMTVTHRINGDDFYQIEYPVLPLQQQINAVFPDSILPQMQPQEPMVPTEDQGVGDVRELLYF